VAPEQRPDAKWLLVESTEGGMFGSGKYKNDHWLLEQCVLKGILARHDLWSDLQKRRLISDRSYLLMLESKYPRTPLEP
jgi:hypothetical protein